MDEPITYYTGASYSSANRNYFTADERGSIVAFMDNAGTGAGSNKYTPDGEVSSLAGSRFGYTGQAWLAPLSLHHYKARMHSPRLATFMQPDPVGYGDGLNMYAYVHNDPINGWDPSGLGADDIGDGPVLDPGASPPTGSFSYGPIDLRVYYMLLNARWRSAAAQIDSERAGLRMQLPRRKWAKLGKRDKQAEVDAVLWLEANGYTVLATQVYIKTSIGTRITDIIAIDTREPFEPAFGVEVKANSATRSKLQRAKDLVIATKGGEVRSWIKTNFPHGTHLKFRTYVWWMDMGAGTLNCPVDQMPSPTPIP